jgi:myo-inositol-1(or 4)-monophosphatase
VVSFGLNQCYREYTDQMFRTIRNIFDKSMDMRRLGTSSLDLAYVACGRASAFFETILLPWDYAAGLLLVEEAGGKVTAMDGSPVKVPENSSIVATNGLVHNEILEIINDGNDFIR